MRIIWHQCLTHRIDPHIHRTTKGQPFNKTKRKHSGRLQPSTRRAPNVNQYNKAKRRKTSASKTSQEDNRNVLHSVQPLRPPSADRIQRIRDYVDANATSDNNNATTGGEVDTASATSQVVPIPSTDDNQWAEEVLKMMEEDDEMIPREDQEVDDSRQTVALALQPQSCTDETSELAEQPGRKRKGIEETSESVASGVLRQRSSGHLLVFPASGHDDEPDSYRQVLFHTMDRTRTNLRFAARAEDDGESKPLRTQTSDGSQQSPVGTRQ